MKLTIKGVDIPLDDNQVALSRGAVDAFLNVTKSGANKIDDPTIYWTTVLMAYMKTSILLDSITPEVLARMFEAKREVVAGKENAISD